MDWPTDLQPYRWNFYLQNRSTVFRSPLTGSRQVLTRQGARWIATGGFRLTRDKAQRFEALLAKMRGQAFTVNLWDLARPEPRGPALDLSSIAASLWVSPGGVLTHFASHDSPPVLTGFAGAAAGLTVYGSHAIGADTLIIRGFPQYTTQLLAGDYVGLGGYLYMLTDDATANGLNRATLSLNRGLVTAVAHRAAVTLVRPSTPMQLVDDDQPNRGSSSARVFEYSVSLVEAFA